MSTTTATFAPELSTTLETAKPRKGWVQRLIEARQRHGESRVRAVFARMSDSQLKDIGFDPHQIRHVRAHGSIPADFWG